jgi:hypothetical protein
MADDELVDGLLPLGRSCVRSRDFRFWNAHGSWPEWVPLPFAPAPFVPAPFLPPDA